MPATPHPGEWIAYASCLALAALVIGLGKSGFGGGLGLFAVAMLSLVVSPQDALGLMLPLVLVGDAVAVAQHRGHCDWPLLRWALPGGGLGLVIGGGLLLALARLQSAAFEQILSGLIGGLCLLLVLALLFQRWAGRGATVRATKSRSISVGIVSSVLGVVAQAGGPVMGLYIVTSQKNRRGIAGTLAVFFCMMNLAKTPLYIAAGLFTAATFAHSLYVLPFLGLGAWLGGSLNKRIPLGPFQLVIYTFTLISAVGLIWKALA